MYREGPHSEDAAIVVVALAGKVAGIDRATGNEVWRNNLEGGGVGVVDLAIASGRVFASAYSAKLFCLDYKTGKTLWSSRTESAGRGTILVDGEQVFVVKMGYLDCFSVDGNSLWKQRLTGMGLQAAAIGTPGNVRQADESGTGGVTS